MNSGQIQYLACWVTSGTQTVPMGTLPIGAYVIRSQIHVLQNFNSDANDNIRVGWSGSTNALVTDTDVSSTGIKSPTLGSSVGYQSTSHVVNAYYLNSGSEPSQGKALVILEFLLTPRQP